MVIVHGLSSTNLLVKWSYLSEEDFQGQPISYIITHHPDNLESDTYSVSVNYTTNSTTLTNLTVYTTYVINVSAESSGGIGPANTAKARTGAEGKEGLKWLYETVLFPKDLSLKGETRRDLFKEFHTSLESIRLSTSW